MVLIIVLYSLLVWLIFFKLKVIAWGWVSGAVTVLIGVGIVGMFVGLFNYLTPSGRIAVTGRVVDVTPNVTGQVVAARAKKLNAVPTSFKLPVETVDELIAAGGDALVANSTYKKFLGRN